MKKIIFYVLPILLGFLIGYISRYFQIDAIQNWYPLLNKPPLTPPNSIFPIAWSSIYVLSGISLGIILNNIRLYRQEIILWSSQLVLNFMWSLTFFYFQNTLLGLITIILLDIVVLWYIIRTYKINQFASILYFPYMAWILFATYLNTYILFNN